MLIPAIVMLIYFDTVHGQNYDSGDGEIKKDADGYCFVRYICLTLSQIG